MRRANAELFAVAALAALGAVVVAFVPNPAVRLVFALPLLFVLPGIALVAALFPSTPLDRTRRLVIQLGMSLAVGVLGALLLDLTPFGLRRGSWAVLLALVTWAAVAVAIRRQAGRAPGALSAPRIRFVDGALFGLALVLVAGTLVFARTPLAAKNVQGYTALSMLPTHGSKSRIVRVRIMSGELQPRAYRLELYVGRKLLEVRHVALAPGQRWQTTVRLTPKNTSGVIWIRARLYRTGHPHAIYRSVWLRATSP